MLYGSRFTDLCYGYCAFWRHHLDALGLTADGFEIETELVLRALQARLEIREVPSFEQERLAGVSNLNAFSDGTAGAAHDARGGIRVRHPSRDPLHAARDPPAGVAKRPGPERRRAPPLSTAGSMTVRTPATRAPSAAPKSAARRSARSSPTAPSTTVGRRTPLPPASADAAPRGDPQPPSGVPPTCVGGSYGLRVT